MILTASKVDVAAKCVGALVLPQTRHATPEVNAGNERHEANDAAVKSGDIPAWLDEVWPGYTWRSEVAFAYDLETGIGRELAGASHRDYSDCSPTEVPGTADVVGTLVAHDGRIVKCVIPDLKSYDPNVPRAAVNRQLATLALAATSAYALMECEVAIKHELRPLDRATLDSFDLEAHAIVLRDIRDGVERARRAFAKGVEPETTIGSQCRWCEAFNDCPKQRALATEVRSGAAEFQLEAAIPCHDDASASALYDFTKRLRMLLKRANSALHARALERPIPLSNGMLYGKVAKPGDRQLNADMVYDAVRARYGQDAADKVVKRTVTFTSLSAVVKEHAPKGAAAELGRKIVAEVEALGGVTRKPSEEFEEYPPHELKQGATGVLKAANE